MRISHKLKYLNFSAKYSFVVTTYQRSPPEVQIELQHGGERDCCRLWTPGALYNIKII